MSSEKKEKATLNAESNVTNNNSNNIKNKSIYNYQSAFSEGLGLEARIQFVTELMLEYPNESREVICEIADSNYKKITGNPSNMKETQAQYNKCRLVLTAIDFIKNKK